MQEHYSKSARDICNALLEHATKDDARLPQIGQEDHIDDKTVFIIKRGVKDTSTNRNDGVPAFQPAFEPTSERSHVCDSLPS